MPYTVFHLGPAGVVPSFDLLVCESDAELRARLEAAFAERTNCEALEVWQENRPLFTVHRPQG